MPYHTEESHSSKNLCELGSIDGAASLRYLPGRQFSVPPSNLNFLVSTAQMCLSYRLPKILVFPRSLGVGDAVEKCQAYAVAG